MPSRSFGRQQNTPVRPRHVGDDPRDGGQRRDGSTAWGRLACPSVGQVDRRTLLKLAGASALLGACGGQDAAPGDGQSVTDAAAAGTPTPTAIPALPTAARYSPLPGEPVPNGKQVAADFVQALTTRRSGQQPADVLAELVHLTSPSFDAGAASALAAPLYPESVTTGEVVYPQLGGLRPLGSGATSASMMVVVRQRLLSPNRSVGEVVRTIDVRLAVESGTWKVVELASVGGEPVDRPADLDARAVSVLDHSDIELPDTCAWDIHAGRISLELLGLLANVAEASPVSVAVLQTGHPVNVFGTDRISNHTEGRAVDIWRVGGEPVVTVGAAAGPAAVALRSAFDDPRLAQAGSPEGSDLDGGGRRSFTDLVHKDHLHLAVGRSAAGNG